MADSVSSAGTGLVAGTDALAIPTFKGRPGWEFTDTSGLELERYTLGTVESVLGEVNGGLWQLPDTFADGIEVERSPGSTKVTVKRGVMVGTPISLALLVPELALINHRTVVVVEEGAHAEVWEQYLSDGDAVLNVDTELRVEAGASLRYVCGQDLSEDAWIFGAQRASVERSAVLDWVALGFGSKSGHVIMNTRLIGEGAEARVTGAYATHGRQHIDFDTTQEHAAVNTVSDLAFRGVLQDRSTAVWKGNIIVDPGAQKTDAFQDSRNLLISKRAHADSIPGLEIQANDVRCTHAAAVAQVDPEQLFYLMSRGIPEAEAKQLVIEGFLAALVERFADGPVREILAETLEKRLALILN